MGGITFSKGHRPKQKLEIPHSGNLLTGSSVSVSFSVSYLIFIVLGCEVHSVTGQMPNVLKCHRVRGLLYRLHKRKQK